MNWEEWIVANKKKIEHVVGFEEQFVRTVLARIPEIEPQDVLAQYHFRDSNGKNRYIDFMIINEAKGYKLPIELDGLWKVEHRHFGDMLKRQNDLVKIHGLLLRYPNKTMLYNPQIIIDEIRETLHLQNTNQLSAKILEERNKKLLNDSKKEIALYKQQVSEQQAQQELQDKALEEQQKLNAESMLTKDDLAELQATMSALQTQIEQPKPSPQPAPQPAPQSAPIEATPTPIEVPKEPKTKITLNHMLGIGVASLVVVAVGANAFYGKDNNINAVNEPIALVGNLDDTNHEKNDTVTIIENNTDSGSESVQSVKAETLPDLAAESVIASDPKPVKPEPVLQVVEAPVPVEAVEAPVEVIEVPVKVAEAPVKEVEQVSYEKPSSDTIPASQAHKHIGSNGVVCGDVAQVKGFSKGTYLNLGARYPNQDVGIVVWSSDAGNFSDLSQYEGQSLCIKGSIKSYKGTPQIKLASLSQLK